MNIDDVGAFMANYGNPADTGCTSSQETCIVYLCEYQSQYWGAGTCSPIVSDDSATSIESEFEAWWVIVQESDSSTKWLLVWGSDDPSSGNTYPSRWMQQYLDLSGTNEVSKTCDGATVYWDNGYYASYQAFYSPTLAEGSEYVKASYSLSSISVQTQPASIPITIGSYSGTETSTFPETIKEAISTKLGAERIIMDDIGWHYTISPDYSDSSEWLFIDESYFGYGCDQIMISQETWEAEACNTCMNSVMSEWSTADNGISTLPYYDYLDLSVDIQDAVGVVSTLDIYAVEDATIDFKFAFEDTEIIISSSNFAFKTPDVCSAVSSVASGDSVKTIDVSFTNCGDVSEDFGYTTNCANGYSTATDTVTVSAGEAKSSWVSAVMNVNCDAVSSVVVTSTCLEFWDMTCSWTSEMSLLTPEPTPMPTPLPTDSPSPSPSEHPSVSPSRHPSRDPSRAPTATPISFFDSCTTFQVVPVRGAVENTVIHQELCLASQKGSYVVDINAKKPYYITVDSTLVTNTTLNAINSSDYDSGRDSGIPATGTALIGHSMIYIERWFDVMAYLGMDTTTCTVSQSISTSIKIDGLDIDADIGGATAYQDEFKTDLAQQIASELSVGNNQIEVTGLRSGSVIADITISSNQTNLKSAFEVNVDLQNYIASHNESDASLTSPLNTVNNFFYANVTNDIVFTNCPNTITATAWEDYPIKVSWDTPRIRTNVDNDGITIHQAMGDAPGAEFSVGAYFIRYVALSTTNTSITPNYCSFAIVVDEKEWVISFMGFELSPTMFGIIVSCMFFLCCGSIIYSCVMRRRGRTCCGCRKKKEGKATFEKVEMASGGFKNVMVSSHDPNSNSNLLASPQLGQLGAHRASAPIILSSSKP